MKTVNLIIFSIATVGLLAACDKGGKRCAGFECQTDAAVIQQKCKTFKADSKKGIDYFKLSSIRSKANKSIDGDMARMILTDFSATNNDKFDVPFGIYLGQPLGAEGELTRTSLLTSMNYRAITENYTNKNNLSELELTCGDLSKGQKAMATIREGEGVITALKKKKITVELTPESLAVLNSVRHSLNQIESYVVTIEEVLESDSDAQAKAEAEGKTKIVRTTQFSLVDYNLKGAILTKTKDIDNEAARAEITRKMMMGYKMGQIPKAAVRQATIVETSLTSDEFGDTEKLSANLLNNLVVSNGAKKCVITLPPVVAPPGNPQEREAEKAAPAPAEVELSLEDIDQLNAKIENFLTNEACESIVDPAAVSADEEPQSDVEPLNSIAGVDVSDKDIENFVKSLDPDQIVDNSAAGNGEAANIEKTTNPINAL